MNLYLDDQKSNIQEIAKILGIKSHELPIHDSRPKAFERLGVKDERGNYKLDCQTRKPVIPAGLSIPMSFDAQTADGSVVKITYSARQSVATSNGISRMKYDNKAMTLHKESMLIPQNEKNLIFFLFISPKNYNSPLNIGKDNPGCDYRFLDTEAAARALNEKEDILIDALSAFKNLGEKEVRIIAKGYRLSEIVDQLSTEEVKTLLRNKVKANASQFLIDIQSHDVALEGTIRDAIDKKVITSRNSPAGYTWVLNGIDLVETPNNTNPIPSLKTIVMGNMDELIPQLKEGIVKQEGPAVKIDPKHFSEFVGDGNSNFDAADRKLIAQSGLDEKRIEKLREWAKVDINDPSIHPRKKDAILKNWDDIQAQLEKDKAEGAVTN